MIYHGSEDSAVTWKVETYGSRHNTFQTYRLGPVSIVVSAIGRPSTNVRLGTLQTYLHFYIPLIT